jgi:hypothetical protein
VQQRNYDQYRDRAHSHDRTDNKHLKSWRAADISQFVTVDAAGGGVSGERFLAAGVPTN